MENSKQLSAVRILNLVHDDKFIDGLITEYDHFCSGARFVVLQRDFDHALKYIRSECRVERVVIGSEAYKRLLLSQDYDVVWVHYLDSAKLGFVNDLLDAQGRRVVIGWSAWGSDLYGILNRANLGKRTCSKLLQRENLRGKIRFLLRQFFGRVGITQAVYKHKIRRFLSNVDFCSGIVPGESKYLRALIRKSTRIVSFRYGSLPSKQKTYPLVDLSKKMIWLGNSATYTNNHFDAFELLRNLVDYTVTAPLSYGDAAMIIDAEGRACFGERWRPLLSFMPVDEYIGKMAECPIFVFPHIRQQALGTVIIALGMGGCLFMDYRNPIVELLLSHKIKVYKMEDLPGNLNRCLDDFSPRQALNVERSRHLFADKEIISNLAPTFHVIEEIVSMHNVG